MTDHLEIRPLRYSDLSQVVAVERRAFPMPWSLAMFVLELSKESGICLAALGEGRLCAYVICSRYDTVWHVMNIAVDPDQRRRGIARALLTELFARADAPGVQYTLEVRPSNRPAIEMYHGVGFTSAGRRPGYYHDNREDAMIMWRTVGEPGPDAAWPPASDQAAPA